MVNNRVNLSQVLENQVPDFINDEFPLFREFLRTYQESNEIPGGPSDLLSNIDQYVKLDTLLLQNSETSLTEDVDYDTTTITVESTAGFPNAFGLLEIDGEIIIYKSKTDTEFVDCVRGFSGMTSLGDEMVFSDSQINRYFSGQSVNNLSVLFLTEFLEKLKTQIAPGFERRKLNENVKSRLFFKQSSDFYKSKGTDEGFKILFKALYGKDVEVIRPSQFVFEASASSNRKTRDLVLYISDQKTDYTDVILHRTLKQNEKDSTVTDGEDVTAYGTITNVERIERGSVFYYLVSLDSDYDKDISVSGTVFGTFVPTPTTRVVEDYKKDPATGEYPEFLYTDSTLSFYSSDEFDAYLDNGIVKTASYDSKTVNEFEDVDAEFEIPKGTLISSKRYGYIELEDETLYFRITSVLSGITPGEDSYFSENDPIKLDTLGLLEGDSRFNRWSFNTTACYNIENLVLLSANNRQYHFEVQTDFDLNSKDNYTLISSLGETYDIIISTRNSATEYIFTSNVLIKEGGLRTFKIERKLNKANFKFFPEASNYITDVQNIYRRENLNQDIFITSSGLPSYYNEQINVNDKRITFSVSLPQDANNKEIKVGQDGTPTNPEVVHSFYNGDSIIYREEDEDNRLSIPNGRYYVTVVDDKTIKLSTSLNRVFTKDYITIEGTVTDNTFFYSDFPDIERSLTLENAFELNSKRLVKKISPPIDQIEPVSTVSGTIGILRNGVEIQSYKSKDSIYYGSINRIDVLSGGEGYDLINPPTLEVDDSDGSGCAGNFVITGSIEDVRVVNGGFNYITDPKITVTGGNGSGCNAIPIMETYTHFIKINASDTDIVDTSANTITYTAKHYFSTGEKVLYNTQAYTEIGGLKTKSVYYVRKLTDTEFQLHLSESDALNGQNPINFTSVGVGDHLITAIQKKKRLNDIRVTYSADDYTHRKVSYDTALDANPVDFYTNEINIINHGFKSGEIVVYDSSTTEITGLTSNTKYYVTKVTDDKFKLSEVGIGTISEEFYYENKRYKDLTTSGVGKQFFRYPTIKVTVDKAIKDPYVIDPEVVTIARGEIKEVFLENKGVGYGCTDIFNYERQPNINAEPGKLATAKPFIVNGKIENVIIQNSGQKYVSTPDIEILTDGKSGFGAVLEPVITNGRLSDIIVRDKGADYNESTEIIIVSAGKNAKFNAKIDSWNVNVVERALNSNQIYNDDGFIYQDSATPEFYAEENGLLQYTHCYAPRKLRQSLYNKRVVNGRATFNPDLQFDTLGREKDSSFHSPILGYAYDGNPIYGPYGFSNIDGTGGIKRMVSGYKKRTLPNRPPLSVYPLGFFVNDYEWFSDGHLDIHNGRYCITPEYPNGVYAYFTTIGNNDSAFQNFKVPAFPYVIGDSYKSKPIDFNFDPFINQISFFEEVEEGETGEFTSENYRDYKLYRNVTPYNTETPYGEYSYLFNPSDVFTVSSKISRVSKGEVDKIEIFSGGKNYQIGDRIIFADSGAGTKRPLGEVVSVAGTDVTTVSAATSTIVDVELSSFFTVRGRLGIASVPHNLESGLVKLSNLDTEEEDNLNITVYDRDLDITSAIDTPSQTGVVTYFNVTGLDSKQSFIPLVPDDIFVIKNGSFREEVKLLNIDFENSRLRVQREVNGTIGTSYAVGTALSENPRKFICQPDFDDVNRLSRFNQTLYFDPRESVGVGIGTTLTINNPGVGNTQVFVPGDRIYLPNNNLAVNTPIKYTNNGGPISVESFGDTFELVADQVYYAYPFRNGMVGISSRKVGVGSTGAVGVGSVTELLTFNNFGSGDNHSFEEVRTDVLDVNVTTVDVTVTTSEAHGLQYDDVIDMKCVPNIEKQIPVFYNQENRKFAFGKFDFVNADIDLTENTFKLSSHGLKNNQKLILEAVAPPGGLISNEVYYVEVVDLDTIKLLDKNNRERVTITTQSSGRFLVINPSLTLVKNKTLNFDVSDFSLSYVRNNIRFSAFDLKFYYDKELRHEFITSQKDKELSVVKDGKLGVDIDASVKLICDDKIPSKLYYNLVPVKNENLPVAYSLISLDAEIDNQIEFVDSNFSGNFKVRVPSIKKFTYRLANPVDTTTYTHESTADITYSTISTTAKGPINDVSFISKGANLIKIPVIESVQSKEGIDAILFPKSESIGIAKDIEIDNIGFDFPSDVTVRPRAFTPTVFKIDPLTSVDNIEVLTVGKNYTVLPDLVLIDGYTNKIADDAELLYVEEDTFKVKIIKNTKNLYDVEPRLLPVNNSNGFKILKIEYDSGDKEATVTLDVVGFSTLSAWPFGVGKKFMVEGVITKNPDGKDEGYNSVDYDYKKLFVVTEDDPNIGGQNPSFKFKLTDFVVDNNPGVYDDLFTSGRVIPESYFPTFKVNRIANKYFENEIVTNGTQEDLVVSWSVKNEILKIFTGSPELYKIGDVIVGKTSGSSGSLTEVVGITSLNYSVDASNAERYKPFDRRGYLNEETQRLHDSDYYQYFAYSIKSEVGISSWREPVQSLAHPSGLKRFSELQVVSDAEKRSEDTVGLTQTQTGSGFLGIADIDSYYDLNCVHDIDLATENNIKDYLSDEVRFNSLVMVDYFESIGNRALIVDDISDQFNSNPRATKFVTVDTFSLDKFTSKKYILFTSNKKFPGERQMIIVNVVLDGDYGYLNQYGRVETNSVHGYFDVGVFERNGLLLFYPVEFRFTDYNISGTSYAISDTISGIATQYVGDIAAVGIQTVTVPENTNSAYKIVGIDSSYTSSKVIVTIKASDESYFQMDEFNIVHDGINIYESEFATLETSNYDSDVAGGIGTYQFDYNSDTIDMKLVPNSGLSTDYTVSSTVVSISNTTRTAIGDSTYNTTLTTVGFASTSVGSATTSFLVIDFPERYKGFNAYVSIEDKTNDVVQFSELVFTHNEIDGYISEFGRVSNDEDIEDTGIGTFYVYRNSTSKKAELHFEPIAVSGPVPNKDIEIRVFSNSFGLVDLGVSTSSIDYDGGRFVTLYDEYTGTENDVKRSFELRHQGDLIFQRVFDATSIGTVVSTEENVLVLPNHFFVTGELLKYSFPEDSSAVGIATTTVPGIGSTDKLPSDLYAVKVDDSKIQFATTAENALKFNPITLTLNAAGIGTQHKITATNKDTKGIYTIDNMVQSPLVDLDIVTTLSEDVALTDTLINTVGIVSFFSGDIVRVNDEVMLIENLGIGTQDKMRVRRPWLGTELGIHTTGDTMTKLKGNYQIVGSTINFTSPPFGKVPVTQLENQFGVPFVDPSDRDYTGITTNSFFHGRTFMRTSEVDETAETYTKNYRFDDLSTKFTGIRTAFELTVGGGTSVAGISTDNAIILVKDIFQQPKRTGVNSIVGNYEFEEVNGGTRILFEPTTVTPGEDVNSSNLPVGGVIVTIGSTSGLGYQPCVAAGGTATVSGLGSITAISIGNSGSGYRPGIQTHIGVLAITSSSVTKIGFATALNGHITGVAITNPGTAYTTSSLPEIRFDAPLGYTNVPLIYSDDSVQGIGTKASLDIFVSRDSSIGEFKFNNNGYAYGQGEKLTVAIGGSTGIPTDTSKTFEEFQITVDRTHTDEFDAWSIGQLQQLDSLDDRFDGVRRVFPISFQGERLSIRARPGSNINVAATLLIFINDVLQIPDQAYTVKGGSLIIFAEPIPKDYTSRVIFYRGTRDVDVEEVDIVEPIEVGDQVKLMSDIPSQTESKRTVEEILSSDILLTNPYTGIGRLNDETVERPVMACKQTEDKFINGSYVGKDRNLYEPDIFPQTNLIQSVGIDTTIAWVENVSTFFDNENENIIEKKLGQIQIISQETTAPAFGTPVVSASGSITSITISNAGAGYTGIPQIAIGAPGAGGTTAIATCTISNGSVDSITVTNTGSGYTTTQKPMVIIEQPKPRIEPIRLVEYDGDFGSIVSVANTVVGVASTAIKMTLYVPHDSYLRNIGVKNAGFVTTGISGIITDHYFTTSNTNIGSGVTSLASDGSGSIIGYSTVRMDNVYQAYDIDRTTEDVAGIGNTDVLVVTALVSDEITLSKESVTFDNSLGTFDGTNLTFDRSSGDNDYFGNFSWGRISWHPTKSRKSPLNFDSYHENGYAGIITSPQVRRTFPLRTKLYTQYTD